MTVVGTTKGRGFAGGMKRYGFAGHRASHGEEKHHRTNGSLSSSARLTHVWKGKRMAGHMGNVRQSIKNLEIVKVDAEKNLDCHQGKRSRSLRRQSNGGTIMSEVQRFTISPGDKTGSVDGDSSSPKVSLLLAAPRGGFLRSQRSVKVVPTPRPAASAGFRQKTLEAKGNRSCPYGFYPFSFLERRWCHFRSQAPRLRMKLSQNEKSHRSSMVLLVVNSPMVRLPPSKPLSSRSQNQRSSLLL